MIAANEYIMVIVRLTNGNRLRGILVGRHFGGCADDFLSKPISPDFTHIVRESDGKEMEINNNRISTMEEA